MGDNGLHKIQVKERIGEISKNKFGTPMKIINYIDSHKVLIEFQDKFKYKKYVTYFDFKHGGVINPYDKSFYNVGYIGETTIMSNSETKKSFIVWNGMLSRCYNPKVIEKHPTYEECFVCDEWLCYANFEKWYNENYYECPIGGKMCIDKDLLLKGNKIYSPSTCCFLPNDLNMICTQRIKNKTLNLPKGITKANNKYRVRIINENGERISLGVYSNIEEAIEIYIVNKKNVIENKIKKYKKYIPEFIYIALLNYEV